MSLLILCDIGNTTYHFFDTKSNRSTRVLLKQKLPKKFDRRRIYFISVNQKASIRLKKNYKSCIDVRDMLNFETHYKGMGIDRQVACALYDHALIVDCGSAITVDVMKNAQHKGGFILPGLNSYEKMFKKISPALDYSFSADVNTDKLPQNTRDALSYATHKSTVLPIIEVIKKYKNLKCFITGGDGKLLQQYIPKSVYKKHLLFDSMKEIIDANNRTAKR
ncbi:MAG: type III pantothenate kinase [Campylobacterota bacterium]|nr:type III pantothenate kinase [Campylobacterota bacterium]